MNFRNGESGQVMVMTLLCMAVLLGFVALAVDVGMLFHAKRNLQTVADAAATAGALDYYKNGLGSTAAVASAQTAAENAVVANGLTTAAFTTSCPVTPSGSTPQACVAIPPSSGVHTGTGYVEVQVVQPNPTTFMSFFGMNRINVNTRAVAGITTGQACIWVKNTLNVQGNAGICGIDPSNPSSWTGSCGSGITCPTTGYVACGIYAGGNITGSGGGAGSNCIASSFIATSGTSAINLNPSPAIQNAATQTPPAFLLVSPPAPSGCTMPPGATSSVSHGVTVWTATLTGTVSAGCYGWDSPPANTVLNLTLNNVSMGNGTYQFNLGSTTIGSGTSAITGGTLTLGSNVYNSAYPVGSQPDFNSSYSGVTLEVYTGNFTTSSTSTGINLYAPNDGYSDPADGIVLWEPASNTATNPGINIQWGSGTGNFYGYIVAPGGTLSMQDQGGYGIVTGLYVGNMNINSQLGVASYNSAVAGSPGKTIALVE
ncbi:MAG TPA: Tad domain-containing protein [Terracidiphilus sp.]|nr:Tad domain-containing protein [Terracidiphilus sp.]